MCSSLVPSIAEQRKQSMGAAIAAVSAVAFTLVEQGLLKLRGIGMQDCTPQQCAQSPGTRSRTSCPKETTQAPARSRGSARLSPAARMQPRVPTPVAASLHRHTPRSAGHCPGQGPGEDEELRLLCLHRQGRVERPRSAGSRDERRGEEERPDVLLWRGRPGRAAKHVH